VRQAFLELRFTSIAEDENLRSSPRKRLMFIRAAMERMQARSQPQGLDRATARQAECFIEEQTGIFFGTANGEGQPYSWP
jgi:hypothetical protein